jgi:predicted DNA-binding ribbon-helix-helix protein
MTDPIRKRSLVVSGNKTSVSLEDAFWTEFQRICIKRNKKPGEMCAEIKAKKVPNLSSAIRVFVLKEVSP